ncbi:MAG: nitrous oxide reductase accessory protein NosL [Paracoccaceae bacterium]
MNVTKPLAKSACLSRFGAVIAALALAACRQEVADAPAAIELSADAAGYYCQMTLLDHQGPKGQIHLDGMPAPLFFSQVKDTIAYLHMPEQSHAVRIAYVQDMSGAATWEKPGPWMPARAAYYVIGSDALGGMEAPEFVPFSVQEEAERFAKAHGGTLRQYDQITRGEALAPTQAPAAAGADNDDIAGRLKALSATHGSH